MLPVSLLFLSLCGSVTLHSGRVAVYQEYRLESLCVGTKNTISLGKQPAVLSYAGVAAEHLQCHLELQLLSEEFGFYVFLDKVWLDNTPGCQQDFLQFGRQV